MLPSVVAGYVIVSEMYDFLTWGAVIDHKLDDGSYSSFLEPAMMKVQWSKKSSRSDSGESVRTEDLP